ncbi:L-threonine ammonia-lyase [Trichomycterus rosablanca]|uniref:L-threonine ammonia-lyase n=1 Tax=Trichomycterus rosablanca TaxID=2290929 RepID=UPI002F360DAA
MKTTIPSGTGGKLKRLTKSLKDSQNLNNSQCLFESEAPLVSAEDPVDFPCCSKSQKQPVIPKSASSSATFTSQRSSTAPLPTTAKQELSQPQSTSSSTKAKSSTAETPLFQASVMSKFKASPGASVLAPSGEDLFSVPSSLHLLSGPESRSILPTFHTVVCLLLRLFLSFILLFLPRDEQRLTSRKQSCSSNDGQCRKDKAMSNGTSAYRPTLISPERLRDFGAEEYINGDVKTFETKVVGIPEVLLMAPPKPSIKSNKESMPAPMPALKPSAEHLCFEDISAAAFKIQQSAIQKTPCTYSRLSKLYGMEIYLKKEFLHYTGSVKERGVFHLLCSLKHDQQKKGVIVATDCNFSMAVAYHAASLNIPVFVIMPAYSSPARLRMYRDYGAIVIPYGNSVQDSRNHACHLAKENSYLCLEENDSQVYLAGLGTVGIEIQQQVPKLDAVIVPAGGQSSVLVAAAAAIKHLNPSILVIGVEPEGFPLLLQSLKTDSPINDFSCTLNKKLYGEFVQHSLGAQTYQLAKRFVDKVITVREKDSLVAMLRFQEYEHTTVDTEGALGLAAILAGQLLELRCKRVAVLVSSANMEFDVKRECVERALVLDDRVRRFSVQLGDCPGEMAKLLDILAREGVRLLEVCHKRYSTRADLFKAEVECVVEVMDQTQNRHLHKKLSDRYPTLNWLDQ